MHPFRSDYSITWNVSFNRFVLMSMYDLTAIVYNNAVLTQSFNYMIPIKVDLRKNSKSFTKIINPVL